MDDLQLCENPRDQQPSSFTWLNINLGKTRVGKMRVADDGRTMTIYSIQIFPEYQKKGLARQVVEGILTDHDTVIADLVRPAAAGFWHKLGFRRQDNQTFRYTRRSRSEDSGQEAQRAVEA